jgi:predicted NBD/HSP70 family sugar kinase
VYEQTDNLTEAIGELQAAVNDDPVNPGGERVRERIDHLRARMSIGLNSLR